MKTLPAQIFKPEYFEGVEKEINAFLETLLFKPLFAIFKEQGMEIKNQVDPLAAAIERGIVSFEGGVFKGEFNAALMREVKKIGAVYSRKEKGWVLSSAPPQSVSFAVANSAAKLKTISQKMIAVLDGVNVVESIKKAAIRHSLGLSLDRMDADWQKTVQSIGIVPRLTPAQAQVIKDEWGANLELYIKDWTESNILKLRSQVMPHAFKGGRSSNMVKAIQKTYGVSKTKATFLARQETSLLMSKLKEQRYQENGITQYRWSSSHDERTRPDHKALDGKIINWSDPPIVDKSTGRKAHAGEDFGCRCVAIPVLD